MDQQEIKPIIIFGTSGAAKEIYYLIKQYNRSCSKVKYNIVGFIAESEEMTGQEVCDGIKTVACDDSMERYLAGYKEINGVIQFGNPALKKKVAAGAAKYGMLKFPNLIHPQVIYEEDCLNIGIGNVIAAGTVIACNAQIGNFNLINRSCTIGHDFDIGNFNTVNPGSVISGNVSIGDECLLGAGCVVLEHHSICSNVVLGAGAVLTKDIDHPCTLTGVPAKPRSLPL